MLPFIQNSSLGTITIDSTGDFASNPLNIKQAKCFALQVVWTGDASGSFDLEASCDANDVIPTTWIEVDSTTVAAGGESGSVMYNVTDAGYSWVRVAYNNLSGTGEATIRASVKGV